MTIMEVTGAGSRQVSEYSWAQVGLSPIGVDSFIVIIDALVNTHTSNQMSLGKSICLMYLRNGDVVDPYWRKPDTSLRLQFTRGEQISYETSAAVDVNRYVIPTDVVAALGTSVSQTGIACFYFASSVMDVSSVGVITGMELVNARIEAGKISSTVPSSGLAAIYSEAGVLYSLSQLQNYHTTFEPYVSKMRSYQHARWSDSDTDSIVQRCKSDMLTYNEAYDTTVTIQVVVDDYGKYQMYHAWGEGPPLFKPGWTYVFWSEDFSDYPISLSLTEDGEDYVDGWEFANHNWTVPANFSGTSIFAKCQSATGMGSSLGAMNVGYSDTDPTSFNRLQVHLLERFCEAFETDLLYEYLSFRAGETTPEKTQDDHGEAIILQNIIKEAYNSSIDQYKKSNVTAMLRDDINSETPIKYFSSSRGNQSVKSSKLMYEVYNDYIYSAENTSSDPIQVVTGRYSQFIFGHYRKFDDYSEADLVTGVFDEVKQESQTSYGAAGSISRYEAAMYSVVNNVNKKNTSSTSGTVLTDTTISHDSSDPLHSGFPLTAITGGIQYTKQTAESSLRITTYWSGASLNNSSYKSRPNQHLVHYKDSISSFQLRLRVHISNSQNLFVRIYMQKHNSNDSPYVVDFGDESVEFGAVFEVALSEWAQASDGIEEYTLVLNKKRTNAVFSSPTGHSQDDWLYSRKPDMSTYIHMISVETSDTTQVGFSVTFQAMQINFSNGTSLTVESG